MLVESLIAVVVVVDERISVPNEHDDDEGEDRNGNFRITLLLFLLYCQMRV